MTEHTCENCKWWLREPYGLYGRDLGECGGCGALDWDAFVTMDADAAIHPRLLTRPDFGCNQWQGKESGGC